MIELLAAQSGAALDLARSRTYPLGRPSGLVALDEALGLLERREAPAVLVGAVDSHLDLELVEGLDREGRLRTGAPSDGFVPGEGAAFLLLSPAVGDTAAPPVVRVDGIGRGRESGHLYSREPYRGEGLTAAFRALFDGLPRQAAARRVALVYTGFNGESFWAKEWGVARIRFAEHFSESARIEHPADCMGDPGAAMGLVNLAIAATALARGVRDGPCLVWASADHEQRAAVLVSRGGTAG
jgi:3-oxoacyl-[acyl-carrier-protein] synthase-1